MELLSRAVFRRYVPPPKPWGPAERELVAKLPPEYAYLARQVSDQNRSHPLIPNPFSASFSRSVRGLERRGLVQLQRESWAYRRDATGQKRVRVIRVEQPRVKLVVHRNSKFFGEKMPSVHLFVNMVDSLRQAKRASEGLPSQ